MKKQNPFHESELDRAKPKRHIFHSLINNHLKRHRSDTGLVEDRTSSVTIVRIIVGLLMIHLIIIGGVLLRGQMVKEGAGSVAAPTSITPPPTPLAPPPPAVAAEPAVQDALPRPTAPVAPAAHTTVAANHITQAAQDEEAAEEVDAEPVVISPPSPEVITSAPAAAAEPLRHRVAQGDTLYRIANQYGTTEAALKAANPSLTQGVLRAGSIITIPTGNTTAAPPAVHTQPTAPMVQAQPTARQQAPAKAETTVQRTAAPAASRVHVVQRGETLSSIARKTNVSVKDLMQINNLKNPNRIRPGMELRLSR